MTVVAERKDPTVDDTADEMDFHRGAVLLRMATDTYSTLLLTVIEAIQNAVDADATTVFVAIDQQRSTVVIADDGTGIAVAKFQQALTSVGQGIKSNDRMGRFGLGMISPLNKCRAFRITSQPKDSSGINQWTFIGEQIRQQHHKVMIPFAQPSRMPEIQSPFKTRAKRLATAWSTMVELDAVTKDRAIRTIDIDELATMVRTKLSRGMLRAGTTVHLALNTEAGEVSGKEVDALRFTGEALPLVEYADDDCGFAVFELYRAPKTRNGRRGHVMVMQTGDTYQITWKEFRAQAMGSRYLAEFKEAFEVLGSGYFEGMIYLEKVELDPQRTKFVLNDALIAAYLVIDRWFEEHGKAHFDIEREQRRDERYQRLGQQSLDKLIARLMKDPNLGMILEELQGAKPPEDKQTRQPRDPSAGTTPRRKRTVAEPSRRKPLSPDTPPGKSGQRVPASLRFAFEQRDEWSNLWDFDFDAATVVFNTLHPVWVMLDESPSGKRSAKHDRQIVHLQTWIGFEVIVMLGEHPDHGQFEAVRHFIDNRVKGYAMVLIDTD